MSILSKFLGINRGVVTAFGWQNPQFWVPLAYKHALANDLEPHLVVALILHESMGGDPLAARFEEGFYAKYIFGRSREDLPGFWPRISKGALPEMIERLTRSISWGLTQIMGQTARELGFDGNYLWELFYPETNIELGCKKLKACFRIARNRKLGGQEMINAGLLLYNGGSNPKYPDLVLEFVNNGRAEELLKYV